MKAFFLLLVVLGAMHSQAKAEALRAGIYQFMEASGKRQTYLLATGKESVQLFECGLQPDLAMIPAEPLESFRRQHCRSLLEPTAAGEQGMKSAIQQGKMLSLHLTGTELPEATSLGSPEVAKSWLAIFQVDTQRDSSLLFTGVGVKVGAGVPRTDTVRIAFEKVREGNLDNSFPLLPIRGR